MVAARLLAAGTAAGSVSSVGSCPSLPAMSAAARDARMRRSWAAPAGAQASCSCTASALNSSAAWPAVPGWPAGRARLPPVFHACTASHCTDSTMQEVGQSEGDEQPAIGCRMPAHPQAQAKQFPTNLISLAGPPGSSSSNSPTGWTEPRPPAAGGSRTAPAAAAQATAPGCSAWLAPATQLPGCHPLGCCPAAGCRPPPGSPCCAGCQSCPEWRPAAAPAGRRRGAAACRGTAEGLPRPAAAPLSPGTGCGAAGAAARAAQLAGRPCAAPPWPAAWLPAPASGCCRPHAGRGTGE